MLTSEQYASSGLLCPICNSKTINQDCIESGDHNATANCRCDTCGAEWTEIYQLTGYANLEVKTKKYSWDEIKEMVDEEGFVTLVMPVDFDFFFDLSVETLNDEVDNRFSAGGWAASDIRYQPVGTYQDDMTGGFLSGTICLQVKFVPESYGCDDE
jgi:hypothetical protein